MIQVTARTGFQTLGFQYVHALYHLSYFGTPKLAGEQKEEGMRDRGRLVETEREKEREREREREREGGGRRNK